MSEDTAVIESEELELNNSSDDLRNSLQEAFKEAQERARDEAGRFAKAPAEAPAQSDSPAPAPAEVKTEPESPAPSPAPAESASSVVKPPDSWSPVAKSKFATLDPEIQAEIARRESEVHKGFTKQDEHRNLGKNFEQAVAPYLPMIKAEGSDPLKAAAALMQTAYNLRAGTPDQKEQLLIGLMNQYQIDPNRVFQRLAGGQSQQADPQVTALQQQVQQLQQVLQAGTQQTEQQQQAQVNTLIESFASDPKNIYFTNVKPEMAALLREGRAKDMQEAYDMACWARPDIRPLLLQQQEQQRQAEARARTQKARAAGSTLTGSPSGTVAGSTNVDPARSLRDELLANLREVQSRE